MFNDIELQRGEKVYTIKADGMMKLIAKVEDIISLNRIINAVQGGEVPVAKISQAYACILRHAGCVVSDHEIYAEMFAGADSVTVAQEAVTSLMILMVPPSAMAPKSTGAETKKKATKRKRAT